MLTALTSPAARLGGWTGPLALCVILSGCGGDSAVDRVNESVAGLPSPSGATSEARPTVSAADLNATINGRIAFEGALPSLGVINMATERVCDAANKPNPRRSEEWVVGDGGGLANVLVQIRSNLPAFEHEQPTEPVVFDQAGCIYSPHVFGIRAGQALRVLNPDRITHNVNAQPKVNNAFNAGMPGVQAQLERTFDRVEPTPFSVRCNVHPWMTAWAVVVDHPYFAVTGPDGSFTISDLPAGTYELEIWHEVAGVQTQTITVGSNATAEANFSVSAR